MERVALTYRDLVVAPGLERAALLALAAEATGARTVLYPGCSVHVTPSRFFEQVTYVDRSPAARAFFEDPGAVLRVVRASASARAGATLRYLEADFTSPLPFPDGSFDLLLALGAGGVSRSCARYVRAGGWILSDDHDGDAFEAASLPRLALVGAVVERGRRLRLETEALERLLVPRAGPPGRRARGPRRTGRPPYAREAFADLFTVPRAPAP
jgi:SAM-dependent methyltransferase